MKHPSIKTLILFTITAFILQTAVTFAQPGPPGPPGGGGTPPCWPPPCIPVDKGISVLIIAGLLLGAYKVYSSSKQKEA